MGIKLRHQRVVFISLSFKFMGNLYMDTKNLWVLLPFKGKSMCLGSSKTW